MSHMPQTAEPPARADPQSAGHLQGDYRRSHHRQGLPEGWSVFVPLVIFFGAAATWSGFQWQQLQLESDTLAALRGNQEAQLQQAQKVRTTLDTLAQETQKLADAGNANARLVVDELRKRGITINRPSSEPRK